MAQDIRELFKKDTFIPSEQMKSGHKDRFMSRLEKELPSKKKNYTWYKIAASIVVILSVSMFGLNLFNNTDIESSDRIVNLDNDASKNATIRLEKQSSTLAEISPEYQEVENTILTSIKFQLAQIKINDSNKELVESFMSRLDDLDKEYKDLNKELIEVGPNVHSVEAMMENLKIRLSLLGRLKDKLKELESIENENYHEIQA